MRPLLSGLEQRDWDVLIVGTGMGGSTLGHALAQAGMQVLFLEKGSSPGQDALALRGAFAECCFPRLEVPQPKHQEILRQAGRCWEEIEDRSARPQRFIPFIGAGAGGSTALYGMALERFFPSDFFPRRFHPQAEGSSLPDSWPISYEQLRPFYEAAERLYRVRGSRDPLRLGEPLEVLPLPPPLTPRNQELFGYFTNRGLHPYQLPLACDYERGTDRCQGFLDAQGCKNDAVRICLQPAIEEYGASLLTDCRVWRIEASRSRVRGVVCRWRNQTLRIRARVVVLAAGALATPTLLLNSASRDWPHGLANQSGLVGANLMRHFVDLYLAFPRSQELVEGNCKQIALNDYYCEDGLKLGTLQSFGNMPPPALIAARLEHDLRHRVSPWLARLFRLLKPFARRVLDRMLSSGVVLASILEDLPYADNRIASTGTDGCLGAIHYRIRNEGQARIQAFRQRLTTLLRPFGAKLIPQAERNEHLAHACGTCRFGMDPKSSVLGPDNRAHALDNLYVVDASFFPSSGGTNPGLTIAANALRVALLLKKDQFSRTRPIQAVGQG